MHGEWTAIKRCCAALAFCGAAVFFSSSARAAGEVAGTVTGPEYTEVADAFDSDNDDSFDIYLKVGYERTLRKWVIRRENSTGTHAAPSDWLQYNDYASAYDIQDILNIEADVGLYEDLQLKLRLPLICNDQRGLRLLGEKDPTLRDPFGSHGRPRLFNLPFTSPQRSGVDYFSAGLDWGIFNQERDETKPSWVIFVEGRFGVGDAMKPGCSKKMVEGGYCPAGTSTSGGGVGRGLNEVYVGTRLARRIDIFNPFFGISGLFGFAKKGTAYHSDKGKEWGAINTNPPKEGQFDFGTEIIPWEVPENFQKAAIGLTLSTIYRSEGREYTPLFDALGTSKSTALVNSDQNGDGVISDWEREYSGMTDVENYATFRGDLSFKLQLAEYIKFLIDLGWGYEQEHFITKTDECDESNQLGSGRCKAVNHDFRRELDSVGQRFRAEAGTLFDFSIMVVAMF